MSLRKFSGQQTNGRELLAGKTEIETVFLYHDLLDADFQRVSRFRARYVDGAGDRMRSASGIFQAELRDLVDGDARFDLAHRMRKSFHSHRVAGIHNHLWLLGGVAPPPPPVPPLPANDPTATG